MMQATLNAREPHEAAWLAALETVGIAERGGPVWRGTGSVAERLSRFVGPAGAQALHLDGARSMWDGIERTAERGVLMATLDGRPTHLFKPTFLALEHFPDLLQDSYLVIGLERLAPYGDVERGTLREERTPLQDAAGTSGVEMGTLDGAGAVSRCLEGYILVACVGSTWANLDAPEIAVVIEYVKRRIARQDVRVAA